ncbi:hypothetical protein BH24CHL5_BH24CHL5_13430 [soil metagenome]
MSESSITSFLPPRDVAGPITCAVCGCRLVSSAGGDGVGFGHFPSLMSGQDARGCRPHCVDALHDRDGRVLLDAAPIDGAATNDAVAA